MKITSVNLNQLYQSIKSKLEKSEQDVSQNFDVPDSKIKLELHIPRDSKKPATLSTVNTHHQVKVNFGLDTKNLDRNLFTALDCIFKLLPSNIKTIDNNEFLEKHIVDIGDNKIEHVRQTRLENCRMGNYPYPEGQAPTLDFSWPVQDDTFCPLAV